VQVLGSKSGVGRAPKAPVGNQMFAVTPRRRDHGTAMAKKLGVDHRRPGGVPPSSAYAYQRSVSLPLAALRPAHSRGHQIVTANRRLQPFRYLHDCSDCFRLERTAGWASHPLQSAALSRRTPKPAVRGIAIEPRESTNGKLPFSFHQPEAGNDYRAGRCAHGGQTGVSAIIRCALSMQDLMTAASRRCPLESITR
jgi:hypothetical protein